ncbi:hypothetical protein [Burkholderia sp. Ac-20379]|uniref:hypothetical protein n=1 Tax=Burkholderia sp. Ac-20379 TaxID=2703900 RepID=UPI001981DB24|nr:hypothetical protein [Burkholderia sp. Ac-20379]MBN3729115.1 hypothetical protein [Burkholderia sp. Ac-20379]
MTRAANEASGVGRAGGAVRRIGLAGWLGALALLASMLIATGLGPVAIAPDRKSGV